MGRGSRWSRWSAATTCMWLSELVNQVLVLGHMLVGFAREAWRMPTDGVQTKTLRVDLSHNGDHHPSRLTGEALSNLGSYPLADPWGPFRSLALAKAPEEDARAWPEAALPAQRTGLTPLPK